MLFVRSLWDLQKIWIHRALQGVWPRNGMQVRSCVTVVSQSYRTPFRFRDNTQSLSEGLRPCSCPEKRHFQEVSGGDLWLFLGVGRSHPGSKDLRVGFQQAGPHCHSATQTWSFWPRKFHSSLFCEQGSRL